MNADSYYFLYDLLFKVCAKKRVIKKPAKAGFFMVEIDVVMSLSLAGKSHVVFAFAIPDGAPMSKLLPIGVYGIACVEINSKEDAVMAGVRAEILITYWSNKQQEH